MPTFDALPKTHSDFEKATASEELKALLLRLGIKNVKGEPDIAGVVRIFSEYDSLPAVLSEEEKTILGLGIKKIKPEMEDEENPVNLKSKRKAILTVLGGTLLGVVIDTGIGQIFPNYTKPIFSVLGLVAGSVLTIVTSKEIKESFSDGQPAISDETARRFAITKNYIDLQNLIDMRISPNEINELVKIINS